MRRQVVPIMILAGMFITPSSMAEDIAIDIETDLGGDYFIVEKTGPENRPVVVVKQVDGTYNNFIKREFDCDPKRFRYLGEGESLAAMTASEPESAPDMEDIRPGSISDQIAEYVCPQPEAEPDAEPQAPAQ